MAIPAVPARLASLELEARREKIGMTDGELRRSFEILSHDALNLGHADMRRYPAPDYALPLFIEAASGGMDAYTPYRGNADVRRALAPQLERLLGLAVDPDRELALTAGTQSGLFSTLGALIEEGARVALPDPEYMDSERILRYCGADVVRVPMTLCDGGWDIDLDELERLARDGVRLLLLSNPQNPTGKVFSGEELARITQIACCYDMFVVVDELYGRLVYDGAEFHHLAAYPGMRERTATVLGPSKTEQLSGYRLGCVVAPAEVIDRTEEVLEVTAIRAPAYAQNVLVGWLRDDVDYMRKRVAEYQEMRDVAFDALSAIDFVHVAKPQGTSYIFPSVRALDLPDLALARGLQERAGVIVTPGSHAGVRAAGCFRICFAQDREILAPALERIGDALTNMMAERA